MKGLTGENLLVLLERRLDNVVYRLGFATSRAEARQLVRHGHFQVNGRKANIPSMLVRAGDVVALREGSRAGRAHPGRARGARGRERPELARDRQGRASRARSKALPVRDDITMPIHEQLIVELYSR